MWPVQSVVCFGRPLLYLLSTKVIDVSETMIASSPPHRKGPYSAYEMKTILTTLVDNQEEFNGNKPEVYRKVSEALSENVFGRTPLQIQMLYGDLKKLYINVSWKS